MKIIIIPHLPTLYGRRYNLAKALADQRYDVHFIVWDMPYPLSVGDAFRRLIYSFRKASYRHSNFMVHKVRRLPFFWPKINGWLFKWQISHLCDKYAIDLIISQAYTNETEPPSKFPLVYDINDDHLSYAKIYGSRLYRVGFKLLGVKSVIERQCRKAVLVTVVSDSLLSFAKQYNDNVIKIPNGVEKVDPKFIGIKSVPNSLIYVSTFGKWSKVNELIDVIDELRFDIQDIHLDLVGDGIEGAPAQKKINRLGLENYITIHGKIDSRERLFELISKADTCLNLSEKNNFRDAASPIKVIEYSALGKKVISTDINEVKALNFPNIYIYADSSGSNGLKNRIIEVFNASVDAKQISFMVSEKYSWVTLSKTMILKASEAL